MRSWIKQAMQVVRALGVPPEVRMLQQARQREQQALEDLQAVLRARAGQVVPVRQMQELRAVLVVHQHLRPDRRWGR